MLSSEAYSLVPWEPSIQGTRGAVLVERGEIDAGADLLERALSGVEIRTNKASCLANLAIARYRQGQFAAEDDARQVVRIGQQLRSFATSAAVVGGRGNIKVIRLLAKKPRRVSRNVDQEVQASQTSASSRRSMAACCNALARSPSAHSRTRRSGWSKNRSATLASSSCCAAISPLYHCIEWTPAQNSRNVRSSVSNLDSTNSVKDWTIAHPLLSIAGGCKCRAIFLCPLHARRFNPPYYCLLRKAQQIISETSQCKTIYRAWDRALRSQQPTLRPPHHSQQTQARLQLLDPSKTKLDLRPEHERQSAHRV